MIGQEECKGLIDEFDLKGHLDEYIHIEGHSILAQEYYKQRLDDLGISKDAYGEWVKAFYEKINGFDPLISYIRQQNKSQKIPQLTEEHIDKVIWAFVHLVVTKYLNKQLDKQDNLVTGFVMGVATYFGLWSPRKTKVYGMINDYVNDLEVTWVEAGLPRIKFTEYRNKLKNELMQEVEKIYPLTILQSMPVISPVAEVHGMEDITEGPRADDKFRVIGGDYVSGEMASKKSDRLNMDILERIIKEENDYCLTQYETYQTVAESHFGGSVRDRSAALGAGSAVACAIGLAQPTSSYFDLVMGPHVANKAWVLSPLWKVAFSKRDLPFDRGYTTNELGRGALHRIKPASERDQIIGDYYGR